MQLTNGLKCDGDHQTAQTVILQTTETVLNLHAKDEVEKEEKLVLGLPQLVDARPV